MGHREHVSAGRPTLRRWAEPEPLLAACGFARMRCERGSVVAVWPASSRELNTRGPHAGVGLDLHRVFAEAVMLENGKTDD